MLSLIYSLMKTLSPRFITPILKRRNCNLITHFEFKITRSEGKKIKQVKKLSRSKPQNQVCFILKWIHFSSHYPISTLPGDCSLNTCKATDFMEFNGTFQVIWLNILTSQMRAAKAKKVKWLSQCTQLTFTHQTSKFMLFLLLHNASRLSVIRYETLNIYSQKRFYNWCIM